MRVSLVAALCLSVGLILGGLPGLASSPLSELRFRLTADPVTLDWNLAHTSYETHIIMNLMEGLVEEGPDLKPRPALAERWEVSPDGRTYQFYLRGGVKWSDGRALKASDFRDSWIRLLDPKTKSKYASFLFDLENAEAFHAGKLKDANQVGVKAVADNHLTVKLRKTVPYFLHMPSFWVTFPIRLDLIKKYGAAWATPGKIATLGPYRLSKWEKGKLIALEKNPDYFALSGMKGPFVKTIQAVVEPNDSTARELFEAEKIDILLNATTSDLLKARNANGASHIRVEQFPYLATYYVGFNVNSGPLKSVGVRKAIALAIASERDNIPAILQGGQLPATGWIPPGMDGFNKGAQVPGTLFDARGELARAGFVDGKGFPKLALWVEKFDGSDKMAAHLVKTIREKIGIDLEIRTATSTEFSRVLSSGEAPIFINHWGADFPDAANFYEVFGGSSGTNYTGWKSSEYDNYMEAARSTLDQPSRLTAYAAAEKILLEREVVVLPLFYRKNTVLLNSRVKDFEISPLNYLFFKSVKLKNIGGAGN